MIRRVEQLVAHTVVLDVRRQNAELAALKLRVAKYEDYIMNSTGRYAYIERCDQCHILFGLTSKDAGDHCNACNLSLCPACSALKLRPCSRHEMMGERTMVCVNGACECSHCTYWAEIEKKGRNNDANE